MSELSSPLTQRHTAHLRYAGHIVALASLGFLSGLVTLASFHYGVEFGDKPSLKGSFFGAAMALYLVAFRRIRSPWKATLLIATSVVAYYFAVGLGAWLPDFFAGAVGGCLVFAAVLFLAAPDLRGLEKYRLLILYSAIAGLLGGLGWLLGPSLGARLSNLMDRLGATGYGFDWLGLIHDSVYAVYPVWQAGMGALIGVLLWALDRKSGLSQAAGTGPELSISARIFFACMLFFAAIISFYVLKTLPGPWQTHQP